MKLFDKAILKLTAIFTGILLLVSIGFSAVVYNVASSGTRRELSLPNGGMVYVEGRRFNVGHIVYERDAQIRQEILTQLILVNIAVMGLGVVVSYMLARWTLKPVHEAYEAQTRFVSDASHELRTPLAAILMENEVLLRDKSATKDDFEQQVKSNIEETQKLQSLTNYLLDLSRNEPLKLAEVDIKNVLSEAAKKLSPLAEAKEIKIATMSSTRTVKAERGALLSIISILIENAIKYSPENTRIRVVADQKTIQVIDEGCGIAEDDLPHIFERFYRSEKSRTSDGYGLGLSLAQSLASKMNMKVTAKNNESGRGATFSLEYCN